MYAPNVSMLLKGRVAAIGLAAGLATLAANGDSGAQPAPGPAPAQPDYARAKQLYDSATAAFDKGQWSDAERDFGAAAKIMAEVG